MTNRMTNHCDMKTTTGADLRHLCQIKAHDSYCNSIELQYIDGGERV